MRGGRGGQSGQSDRDALDCKRPGKKTHGVHKTISTGIQTDLQSVCFVDAGVQTATTGCACMAEEDLFAKTLGEASTDETLIALNGIDTLGMNGLDDCVTSLDSVIAMGAMPHTTQAWNAPLESLACLESSDSLVLPIISGGNPNFRLSLAKEGFGVIETACTSVKVRAVYETNIDVHLSAKNTYAKINAMVKNKQRKKRRLSPLSVER